MIIMVNRGVLTDGQTVAVKVQYPGVAESIDSDLINLKRIATLTNLIPKGLYIDNVMKAVKEELARECNYSLEAENQVRRGACLQNFHRCFNAFYFILNVLNR
jgi:aarF domain-containing kinase